MGNVRLILTELSRLHDAIELVESLGVNYYLDGKIDPEQITSNTVAHLLRDLGELDAVAGSDALLVGEVAIPELFEYRVATADQASALAHNIREAIARAIGLGRPDLDADPAHAPAPKPAHEHTGFEAGAL